MKPGIKGRITIKFAIDSYGRVLYLNKEFSTLNDSILESAIIKQIINWKFGFLYTKEDVTEIIYTFIFSQ